METLYTILLGIIQGVTEFLPVSSSGHLVIFSKIFGLEEGGLFLSLVLHSGTLLAVIIFFFKDLMALLSSWRYSKNPKLYYIILATFPTALIGLAIHKIYSEASSLLLVGVFLLVTGALVSFSKRFTQGKEELTLKKSLLIGTVQGIAAFPGISRSGSTISAALMMGIRKEDAFTFSFLLSVPAIIGADLLEFREILTGSVPVTYHWVTLISGFFASFAAGIASLWILKRLMSKNFFHVFGYYCLLAGAAAIIAGGIL